jgi:glycosyltransferase involved in cell wall biosynthesis
MRILIATVQVPFVHGGAEVHADELRQAFADRGHEAEIAAIPFKWYPPERIVEHMLAVRLLDFTEFGGIKVDRVVGLKFPAYFVHHPDKVIWMLHQHRQAYDLWDHPLGDLQHYPNGQQVRDAIRHADRRLLPEARRIYANSVNVARRLERFCNIEAAPLYHPPPHAEAFFTGAAESYFYFPSRVNPTKRQTLVIRALAHTEEPVKVKFSGAADTPEFERECRELAASLRVGARVDWLGAVPEAQKRDLYAHCLAVLYPPVDEDYGYVTLEAMLARKPVLTCSDSGGPLEFIDSGENGIVARPDPRALAAAMDRLWRNRDQAVRWGRAARERYERMNISWSGVVEKLLA